MKRRLISPLLLLLVLAGACAPTQAPRTAPAANPAAALSTDLAAELPTDPAVKVGKLENGLTYFIRRNAVPADRVELYLVVNAGSVLEDEDQLGLAHFVEHMAFNGTERFAKQELVQYLESIGMRFGADVNAYTNFDETVYTLTVPTDKPEFVEKGLEILEDWAHGITFDPAEVDKERGVVVEEWRLGRGAQARMQDEQFPILFQGSRYAERLPIGKKEVLETASAETLRRFYRDWYRPDLMAVVAVGDIDRVRMEELIRQRFGHLRGPGNPRPRELFPVPDHAETLVAVTTDPEETDTKISLFSKQPVRPQNKVGDYRRMIVEALYHGMLTARLDEIARQADPPFLWAGSSSGLFVRSSEVTFQDAAVREGEVERGLAALLAEVERVRRHGFTATELERAKVIWLRGYEQAAQQQGTIASPTFAQEYVRVFLEDESMPGIAAEHALTRALLPGIGLQELNHLADEWLQDRNRVILVTAPRKEGTAAPTREALLTVFRSVKESEITPFVDRVQEGPLVAKVPAPGRIVEEKKIEELGVTEWRLSNGVRVVLRPTDVGKDQIFLTAFSPGGHSLVSDAELPSALFAAPAVSEGGVGSFDEVMLEKALAGKGVRVEPYITQLEEGVQGAASGRDVETLFELVYLTLTAPRKDEDAFRSFQTLLHAAVQNRLAQPETVFGDKMTEALTQHHPRWEPVSPAWVDRIDLDTAYRIYQDRFADLGDATFVIVGSFTTASIKPLVLTWLGSLPSNGRQETWRDVGMRPPGGVVRVDVEKGIEPKAQVRMVFTGDAPFTRQDRHDLNALAAVLDTRLREVLREDMGAVYGVQVSGDIIRRPRERYNFNVGFGCAPEKVDELVQAVFAEIDAIQRNGVAESYLQQVRETERRQRELDLQDNQFWLGILELYYTEGLDPRDILRFDDLVQTVSSDRVRDTARRYLTTERYVLGVLKPEGGAAKAAS